MMLTWVSEIIIGDHFWLICLLTGTALHGAAFESRTACDNVEAFDHKHPTSAHSDWYCAQVVVKKQLMLTLLHRHVGNAA